MKNIIILTITCLLLISCGTDSENGNTERNSQVRKYIENIVKPEEDRFYNDALELQNLTNNFVKETTKNNLEQLKTQWFEVAKDWARCFAFNIGEVKKGKFFKYFATFPVNTSALEYKIKKISLKELTPKRVNDFGLDTKGIYGIEYLIFKGNSESNLEEFKTSEVRKKTLQLIVNEFINDLKNRQKIWKEYAPKFIKNNIDKGDSKNSINLMFGGIDNIIHFTWETKIGKAIRKNDIEARYSKKSLDIIKENIAITKKVYFEGGFAENIKNNGLNKLNEDITERYKNIENIINSIGLPLVDVVNKEKDKLNKLIDELKALENKFNNVEVNLKLLDGAKEGDGD